MVGDVSMKAFKRREVTDLQHLRTLVTDNADAVGTIRDRRRPAREKSAAA